MSEGLNNIILVDGGWFFIVKSPLRLVALVCHGRSKMIMCHGILCVVGLWVVEVVPLLVEEIQRVGLLKILWLGLCRKVSVINSLSGVGGQLGNSFHIIYDSFSLSLFVSLSWHYLCAIKFKRSDDNQMEINYGVVTSL